jgi:hypothetical protein
MKKLFDGVDAEAIFAGADWARAAAASSFLARFQPEPAPLGLILDPHFASFRDQVVEGGGSHVLISSSPRFDCCLLSRTTTPSGRW